MAEDTIAFFTVAGEPMSKARARFTRGGGSYTPARTREAEGIIALAFYEAVGEDYQPDATAAFGIEARFFHGTRQRRDIDNQLKLVMDALNKLAWADDSQVREIRATKIAVLEDKTLAHTEVHVYRLAEPDPMLRATCKWCGQEYRTFQSWIDLGKLFCNRDCHTAWRRNEAKRECPSCHEFFVPHNAKDNNRQVYCSGACRTLSFQVAATCAECGVAFTRKKSAVRSGHAFCSAVCRQEFWRKWRARSAQGVCSVCGGTTTKKTYTRCRSCALSGTANAG